MCVTRRQVFLLLLALLAVPWMLFPKPLILNARHKAALVRDGMIIRACALPCALARVVVEAQHEDGQHDAPHVAALWLTLRRGVWCRRATRSTLTFMRTRSTAAAAAAATATTTTGTGAPSTLAR